MAQGQGVITVHSLLFFCSSPVNNQYHYLLRRDLILLLYHLDNDNVVVTH